MKANEKEQEKLDEKPKKSEIFIFVLICLVIVFQGLTFIQRYMMPFQPLLFLSSTEFIIGIVFLALLFIAWAIVAKKKVPQNFVDLQQKAGQKVELNIPNPLQPQKKMELTLPPPNLLNYKKYNLHTNNAFAPKKPMELKRPFDQSFTQVYLSPNANEGGTWRCPQCKFLAFGHRCQRCGRMRI